MTDNAKVTKFTKVKILDKEVNIEFHDLIETEDGIIKNEWPLKRQHAVHEDFEEAMQALAGHLLVVLEKTSDDYDQVDEGLGSKIKMKGISINGSDEKESVVLHGTEKLSNGQTYNLVTPPVYFQNSEGYKHHAELYHDCQKLIEEAREYVNGKVRQGTQFSLSFAQKNELSVEHPTDAGDQAPKAAKKGGRTKPRKSKETA